MCQDDPDTRSAIVAALSTSGVRLDVHVRDGADAVVLARQRQPDIAIIDIPTAGSLGIQIVQEIRAVAPGCTVIATSPLWDLEHRSIQGRGDALLNSRDITGLKRALMRAVTWHLDEGDSRARDHVRSV